MKSKLFPFCKKGMWGYLNKSGVVVISPKYLYAGEFFDGVASVRLVNNKFGFINLLDEIIFEHEYPYVDVFNEGLCPFSKKDLGFGKIGFINRNGEVVIPDIYDWVAGFSDGLSITKINNNFEFIDINGNSVLRLSAKQCWSFSEGLAEIYVDDKWGFINKAGEYIINPQYEATGRFANGLAPVLKNGKWGYINKNNAIVVEPVFKHANYFSEGLASVGDEKKSGFVDCFGNLKIPMVFDGVKKFKCGVAAINLGGKVDGDWIYGGKWGYINKFGEVIVRPKYDDAFDCDMGLAQVVVNGFRGLEKIGYVDNNGVLVWKPSL